MAHTSLTYPPKSLPSTYTLNDLPGFNAVLAIESSTAAAFTHMLVQIGEQPRRQLEKRVLRVECEVSGLRLVGGCTRNAPYPQLRTHGERHQRAL